MTGHRPLDRAELPEDTAALARYLIGKVAVRELPEGIVSGRIVETEAYVVGDAAGHAFRGMTRRNRSLFLAPGHAYIYIAYGISFMLNVASETEGIGAGVLIRALEPAAGLEQMRARRGGRPDHELCSGPGKLTEALGIGLEWNGAELTRQPFGLAEPAPEWERAEVVASPRIGITKATERPWRFSAAGSRFVSRPRPRQPAPASGR